MERLPDGLRIFLCYASEDERDAGRLKRLLSVESRGSRFDACSVRRGFHEDWRRRAWEKIAACDAVVCLVGETTHLSEPVNWEIEAAAAMGKRILAYTLAPSFRAAPDALRARGVPVRRLAPEPAREPVVAM